MAEWFTRRCKATRKNVTDRVRILPVPRVETLGKFLTYNVPLSTQQYNWVPGGTKNGYENCELGLQLQKMRCILPREMRLYWRVFLYQGVNCKVIEHPEGGY